MKRLLFFLAVLLTAAGLMAQEQAPKNWWELDRTDDSFPGVSAAKAHNYLKGKTAHKVVVAVIDSGVDIEHEDLKDIIWTNPGEVAGNGIDDDNNGYVDDVHGWNFIGGKDGQNVNYENLEVVRLWNRYHKKYNNRNRDGLSKTEKAEYDAYIAYGKEIDKEREELEPVYATYTALMDGLDGIVKQVGKKMGKITGEDVANLKSKDMLTTRLQSIVANSIANGGTFEKLYHDIEGDLAQLKGQYEFNYNKDYDGRSIVGDNPGNLDDQNYGNNDVEGPDCDHGTHVAGIIAAVRDNDLGVNGVAGPMIEIMSIRTVPNGDERDKDVANAIRYAVDNGASVINMSFGKGYSPYKFAVDAAMKYA
ncbi:MAG: S8 family serine peptidase, partial [Bacteroidota bacterium]